MAGEILRGDYGRRLLAMGRRSEAAVLSRVHGPGGDGDLAGESEILNGVAGVDFRLDRSGNSSVRMRERIRIDDLFQEQ